MKGMENDYADMNQVKADMPEHGKAPENNMALASLIMGIIAVVSCCCCYLSIGFGALSVIFALLSRVDEPLSGKAKAGIGLSIAAIALTVLFFIFLLVFGASSIYNAGLGYSDLQNLSLLRNVLVIGGGR